MAGYDDSLAEHDVSVVGCWPCGSDPESHQETLLGKPPSAFYGAPKSVIPNHPMIGREEQHRSVRIPLPDPA